MLPLQGGCGKSSPGCSERFRDSRAVSRSAVSAQRSALSGETSRRERELSRRSGPSWCGRSRLSADRRLGNDPRVVAEERPGPGTSGTPPGFHERRGRLRHPSFVVRHSEFRTQNSELRTQNSEFRAWFKIGRKRVTARDLLSVCGFHSSACRQRRRRSQYAASPRTRSARRHPVLNHAEFSGRFCSGCPQASPLRRCAAGGSPCRDSYPSESVASRPVCGRCRHRPWFPREIDS